MRRLIGRIALAFAAAALASSLSAQTGVADLLRRAEAAFADEDRALAEKLYRQVLAVDPYQSRAAYRLGQLSRDDEAALGWFRRYSELEPDDAWGHLAVGDRYLKLGKDVEALAAYREAARLAPKAEDIRERSAKARARAAPAVEPLGLVVRDTDLNRTTGVGLAADIAVPGGLRLGARAMRSDIGDGTTNAVLDEFALSLAGRPRSSLRLNLAVGAARLGPAGLEAWTTPAAEARLRWRPPAGGPSVEARVQRLPLGTSPLLVANRAVRDEVRLSAELPAGPIRLRLGGRAAIIETLPEDGNSRLQGDAAVVLPFGWRGEISAQYHRLGFGRASAAGYFAPRLVESIEAGTYWDLGGDGRVSLSIDLGAGIQRLARQGEAAGAWKTALRGWGLVALDIVPAVQATLEAEGYSAPFAPVGVSTAPGWKYFSARLGLRFRFVSSR